MVKSREGRHYIPAAPAAEGRTEHNNKNNRRRQQRQEATTERDGTSNHGGRQQRHQMSQETPEGRRKQKNNNGKCAQPRVVATKAVRNETRRAEESPLLQRFINRLERSVKRKQFLELDDPDDKNCWFEAWSLKRKPLLLLKAWLLAAAKYTIAPSALDQISVLRQVTATGNFDGLTLLVDVIEFRIAAGIIMPKKDQNFKKPLQALKLAATARLMKLVTEKPDDMIRGGELMKRLNTACDRCLKMTVQICQEQRDEIDIDRATAADTSCWQGWQQKTSLEWLTSGRWLDAPGLSTEPYESVERYADTLEQLVTLLTFYWAAGAVFPRCRHMRQGMYCSQPLLMPCSSKHRQCRQCSKQAIFGCSQKGGHDAICAKCLKESQAKLTGPPSPQASTDLYDCIVERETIRREGQVLILRSVKSRKPPNEKPNWRTTYRLKCSALVAVFKSPESMLAWAEIVPISTFNDEYKERERGRLAIRLLTSSDAVRLVPEVNTLEFGSRLTLIDCQVFVPEVFSVLSTITAPDFCEHMRALPFADQLLNTAEHDNTKEAFSTIEDCIRNSEIDLIKRLSPNKLEKLVCEISTLAKKRNLYGTQLESFCWALKSALHVTQGPPGTGKSYLGVQLITALNIIRRYATEAGMSVGPIVLLSYKNHALDEMLIDVIQSDKSLFKPGALIRCGNPEDERLQKFKESATFAEKDAQDVLSRRLACLREAQKFAKNLQELAREFIEAARDLDAGTNREESIKLLEEWVPRHGSKHQAYVDFVLRAFVLARQDISATSSEEAYKLLEAPFSAEELPNDITQLSHDVDHWICMQENKSRLSFLMQHWLGGRKPPPRCKAAKDDKDGCILAVDYEGAYCHLHKCNFDRKCPNRRYSLDCHYCEEHMCPQCAAPRHPRSEACVEHSCDVCSRLGFKPLRAVRPGTRACIEHLCLHKTKHCPNARFVTKDHRIAHYCKMHGCKLCLSILCGRESKYSLGSVLRVENTFLCCEHKCQVETCSRHRVLNKLYCEGHCCTLCPAWSRKPVDEACPSSRLCQDHRCEFDAMCKKPKLVNASFCQDHVCARCLTEGLPLNRFIVDIGLGKNLCQDHLIAVKLAEEKTAASASIDMQCFGLTKKKKLRCRTLGQVIVGSKCYYCEAHFDQQPPSDYMDISDNDDEADLDENDDNDDSDDDDDYGYDDNDNDDDDDSDDWSELSDRTNNSMNLDGEAEEALDDKTESILLVIKEEDLEINDCGIEESKSEVEAAQEIDSHQEQAEQKSITDFGERTAYGIAPDEIDLDSLSDGYMENDQLLHLRDIIGEISDASSSSSLQDEAQIDEDEEDLFAVIDEPDFGSLSWNASLKTRWLQCVSVLKKSALQVTALVAEAEEYVQGARLAKAEAAGTTFKRSRLIGATVVGATRRLEAIRASEPFAIIVEEACEVLEPTLISVLAVRSLRKLELIGDHRQLPAFVQQCWYPLETTHPSIKVSLFERLINTCNYHILDEQRRMRPEICDLTRCHYEDVVDIIDHDITKTKRVGDQVVKHASNFENERNLWDGKGTLVPGIHPQQYFWEIEGSCEGRAHVGMSRANPTEARASARLAKWLQTCGVPPKCITIITPYKGQKLTILRELQKIGAISRQQRYQHNVITVSTVDRYQGDENDVVILSLVKTKPGNAFVALRNRYIVALSRARLATIVIGTREAVAGERGPDHWRRLVSELEKISSDFVDKRIGSRLKLCCPRHRSQSQMQVKDGESFPMAAFCTLPCSYVLPWCEHRCQRTCHSVLEMPHTELCAQLVQRPCILHRHVPLKCADVLAVSPRAPSLKEALLEYKCECKVIWYRPECGHSVPLTCHEQMSVEKNEIKLPPCEEVVYDWFHPECNHVRTAPKCHERRQWEVDLPKCTEKITHKRRCGCSIKISCCEQNQIDKALCQAERTFKRPRCSHKLSLRCWQASQLEHLWQQSDWNGIDVESDESEKYVEHGVSYGPTENDYLQQTPCFIGKGWWIKLDTDSGKMFYVHEETGETQWKPPQDPGVATPAKIPPCKVPVRYLASCGHFISDVLCHEAFECAADERSEPVCTKEVEFTGLCGHTVRGACNLSLKSRSLKRITNERACIRLRSNHNCTVSALQKTVLRLCTGDIKVEREACGHSFRAHCRNLASTYKKPPLCKDNVSIPRACGHSSILPCHRCDEELPPCTETNNQKYIFPCGRHETTPRTCADLCKLNSDSPPCPAFVECRLSRCQHKVSVACQLEIHAIQKLRGERLTSSVVYAGVGYADSPAEAPECKELVVYSRNCGHQMHNIPCKLAFKYAAGEMNEPPCDVLIEVESPLCFHKIKIPCHLQDALDAWQPWDVQPEMTTVYIDSVGKEITKLSVKSNGQRAHPPSEALAKYLKCGHMAELIRNGCSHSSEIPCTSLIFDNTQNAPCLVLEPYTCQKCGLEQQYPCSQLQSAAPLCNNKVYKDCTLCGTTRLEVECWVESVKCNQLVKIALACGHTASFLCGKDEDPRSTGEPCLSCTYKLWQDALSISKERLQYLNGTRDEKGARLAAAAVARQGIVVAADSTFQLEDTLWTRLEASALPEEWIIKEKQAKKFDANRLTIALHEILANYAKQLHSAVENDDDEDLLLVPPPDHLSDPAVYDLVFGESFRPTKTLYGSGIRASLLSKEAILSECEPDNHGCITVNIAAALRFRAVEETPPFRKKDSDVRAKVKGKKEKEKRLKAAEKRAEEMRQQKIGAGYDYVIPPKYKSRRIYWTHSSVVPIGTLKIQVRRPCLICFDSLPRAGGCLCSSNHFICWSCFQEHAGHALKSEALASNTESGKLACPEGECDHAYKIEDVALQLNKYEIDTVTGSAITKALYDIKREADVNEVLPEALQQQEDRLRAEYNRIMSIKDEAERKVQQARLDIIENIITLRCPKCSTAFYDFEGCYALTCANKACKVQFCGWCLKHSDPLDCHHHVDTCPEASHPGYFHSEEIFRLHHCDRQKKLILERLRLDKEQGRRILSALQRELADLNLIISETDI